MKSPVSRSTFLLIALTGGVVADAPKKAPYTKYSGLWVNSPFTSKPPPPEGEDAPNPLDDYALIGVSPIGGSGHRVTLINKKKPDERITVDSDNSKSGFKILGVTRKAGDPLGTVVSMSSGSMTGTVRFDEKLLTLVKAAPPAPPQAQPGQPPQPGQQPVQPGQPQRQPRPRVVPPPTSTAPAPAAPVQPVQQRPQRRGN